MSTSRAWVGKLFKQKATTSAREPLKAAVKVSLPINMCYAEIWLQTNIWVQITQDISTSENQGHVKGAGQLRPPPCHGKLTARVVPFKKRDKQHNSQNILKFLNSKMNPNLAYISGLLLIIASQGYGLALLLHRVWPFVVQTQDGFYRI